MKQSRLPEFTENFRKLQGDRSNTDFAEFLGISRQTVGFYCNAERIPDALALKEIAKKCNVSADWLLGISDTMSPNPDLQEVCEYTGLSEDAIAAICHDTKSTKKKKWIKPIFDYFISEFHLSWLATMLWRSLKNASLFSYANSKNDSLAKLADDRKKFMKWQFVSICEKTFDDMEQSLEPLLLQEYEKEMVVDLQDLEQNTERQLNSIREMLSSFEKSEDQTSPD